MAEREHFGPYKTVLQVPISKNCWVSVAMAGEIDGAALDQLSRFLDVLRTAYRLPPLMPDGPARESYEKEQGEGGKEAD